jgi:Fe-S-cluster containining protein
MSEHEIDIFVCQQCGNCCAIEGYVEVLEEELPQLAAALQLSPEEFKRQYLTQLKDDLWSMIDHPGTTDCIMLTADRRCRINEVKPEQCRLFPAHWRTLDADAYCPGLKK